MTYEEIIKKLKGLSNSKNIEGMVRFGINPKYALGINIPVLRKLAKEINFTLKGSTFQGKKVKHKLAKKLWGSKIHEARILAPMIDEPTLVTEKQMDDWTADFNSWDLCDQTCMNLFWKHPGAYKKAVEWANLSHFAKASREYQRRAGFVMMAVLAVHDKKALDSKFEKFFPVIKREATDERNYVKKAVNWALRQIGKRNLSLRDKSKKVAEDIIKSYPNSKSAQWIAKDALRELSKKKI